MIAPQAFFDALTDAGVEFYAGVPDSLLKEFCYYVSEMVAPDRHVITVNEGAAIALAAGHHLASGGLGMVYLQNSGLGNAINPLLSLVDREVYAIPMLLLIGWRGEPGVNDEPQHRKQGRITRELLDTMEIPWVLIRREETDWIQKVHQMVESAKTSSRATALLVSKGAFEAYQGTPNAKREYPLTREQAIIQVLERVESTDVIVSTTGKTSREIYEWRERTADSHDRDFLTVGSMGHASHIALGIAMARPQQTVWCIDGDGAVLMHMGSLAAVGASRMGNLRHIMINNGAHESVGGQPTVGYTVDLPGVARACGYQSVASASSRQEIEIVLQSALESPGPHFIEIRVSLGARADLGRPSNTPVENKQGLMRFLQG